MRAAPDWQWAGFSFELRRDSHSKGDILSITIAKKGAERMNYGGLSDCRVIEK
jgi:hypothetical protein